MPYLQSIPGFQSAELNQTGYILTDIGQLNFTYLGSNTSPEDLGTQIYIQMQDGKELTEEDLPSDWNVKRWSLQKPTSGIKMAQTSML